MVGAALAGGIPFIMLSTNFGFVWLCENLGCHFGPQFWWFVGTDVAVYCIFKYYMATHAASETVQERSTQNNTTYIELERPLASVPVQSGKPIYKFVYVR